MNKLLYLPPVAFAPLPLRIAAGIYQWIGVDLFDPRSYSHNSPLFH